ncbi:sugar ABC transporter ATP-binding protein [Populibacterium corticicola]|uniref:Sugar ABC transporter ATP-binding protein n=1 Tax=Populibacterium corticicola TaxID=1812826 RepID=A0ABW5XGF2_9MICO
MNADPRVPLVQLRSITVSFDGQRALCNVDLDLHPGEVHAIMGQNGAGKSTLIKVLNGVVQPDSGTLTVDGVNQVFKSPVEALAAGIAVVFQDIHLGPTLTVAENVMLGREIRGPLGIDWKATKARALEQLGELGLAELDLDTRLSRLAPPTQQLVAIARAMVAQPRVLLLDEPTSSLEVEDVKRLFTVIRALREKGVAIVFISHFLEQAYAISDRMTVLRDGMNVGDFPTRELDRTDLISMMLGEDIESLKLLGAERREHQHDPEGEVALEAVSLGLTGVVEPTDFSIHEGEIVGFAGLRGSGRTELANLLAGVYSADTGVVVLDGQRVRYHGPGTGIRHRIAMSTESRMDDGIIADMDVRDNMLLALQALRGWRAPISKAEAEDSLQHYLEMLNMSEIDPHTPARALSGGTQQKILLARWLATQPRVLILDEPTKGIDISTKVEIQRRIAKLADEGMAVVFISSDLEEVVRICDRIVVLKDRGKIGELRNGPGVTVDTVVELIAAANEDGF